MPLEFPETPSKAGKVAKIIVANFPPVAGLGGCVAALWPWLVQQEDNVRNGLPLVWPAKGIESWALAGLVVLPILHFIGYFSVQVWRVIERDHQIYEITASKLSAFPATAWEILNRRWERVSRWLGGISANHKFTRRYLNELPRLRNIVDVRGLVQMEVNHLELDDVYVELKASGRQQGGNAVYNFAARILRDRSPIWDHLRVLKQGVGLAIIGAPGSGKTTLLKHLMLTYAWGRHSRYLVRSRVPFFIELRKLPKLLAKREPDLAEVIGYALRTDEDIKSTVADMPSDWIRALL
ncbi:MAG: NACHT domain-containing protein, partial [Prosthecobacter sp.]|nr:NACHT domain-containing protein [Prosthecobacter sp.]